MRLLDHRHGDLQAHAKIISAGFPRPEKPADHVFIEIQRTLPARVPEDALIPDACECRGNENRRSGSIALSLEFSDKPDRLARETRVIGGNEIATRAFCKHPAGHGRLAILIGNGGPGRTNLRTRMLLK